MGPLKDIANIRLVNQRIGSAGYRSIKDNVAWMGAIQAQDFSMAKWALGVRTSTSTDEKIETSFNRGEILRTHLLRPTWHFVSPDDIHWMLELTAPQIKSSLRSRHKDLELSEQLFRKSNRLIEKLMLEGRSLTREDFNREFTKAKINTGNNRLSHLLLRAELDGLLCSGPKRDKKLTYSLLHDRAKYSKIMNREESLAELAGRYFQSRAPATVNDFSWWSGLSAKDAQKGTESVKSRFITERIGSREYLFPVSITKSVISSQSAYLLPAYDEYLIGYRDRSASVTEERTSGIISSNGIFYPLIVIKGQVCGIWKRSFENDKVIVEPFLFTDDGTAARKLIDKTASGLVRFFNKGIEIRFRA